VGTSGNSVYAQTENGSAVIGDVTVLSGDVIFDYNQGSLEQQVVNAFYLCCYMRDFFYLLGFREVDENFQASNLGRGGIGGDRMTAICYQRAIPGVARMDANDTDGSGATLNLGLNMSTNRHTSLDSSVVFHEYTHAVVKRLLGPVDAPQSRGMNEGWADYIACSVNNSNVVGAWLVNNPGGARAWPYDTNYPDDFSKLGTGRYGADASGNPQDPHNVGEIWCATLLDLNRRVGKQFGLQLVVDGFKTTLDNPSFEKGRWGISNAGVSMLISNQISWRRWRQAQHGIYSAFARYGIGWEAASAVGARLDGVGASFEVAPDWYPVEVLISAVSTTRGGVSLFALGLDGVVRSQYRDLNDPNLAKQSGWSGWFSISGITFAEYTPISAISTKLQSASIFAVNSGGEVVTAQYDPAKPGGWSNWSLISGAKFLQRTAISAVSSKPGGASLFAISGEEARPRPGTSNQLVYSAFFDPTRPGNPQRNGWSDWYPIDGKTFTAETVLGVVSARPDAINIFGISPSGEVWSAFNDPSNPGPAARHGWANWFQIPATKPFARSGQIAAVSTRPGEISLFALGTDRQIWWAFYDPTAPGDPARGGWSNWLAISGAKFPPGSTISAASKKPGEIDVFCVGENAQVQSAHVDLGLGTWSKWSPVGPNQFPSPSIVSALSTAPGGASLFVFGFDEAVWSNSFDPTRGSWSDWFSLGFS
jgi:hypothetical protein